MHFDIINPKRKYTYCCFWINVQFRQEYTVAYQLSKFRSYSYCSATPSCWSHKLHTFWGRLLLTARDTHVSDWRETICNFPLSGFRFPARTLISFTPTVFLFFFLGWRRLVSLSPLPFNLPGRVSFFVFSRGSREKYPCFARDKKENIHRQSARSNWKKRQKQTWGASGVGERDVFRWAIVDSNEEFSKALVPRDVDSATLKPWPKSRFPSPAT